MPRYFLHKTAQFCNFRSLDRNKWELIEKIPKRESFRYKVLSANTSDLMTSCVNQTFRPPPIARPSLFHSRVGASPFTLILLRFLPSPFSLPLDRPARRRRRLVPRLVLFSLSREGVEASLKTGNHHYHRYYHHYHRPTITTDISAVIPREVGRPR